MKKTGTEDSWGGKKEKKKKSTAIIVLLDVLFGFIKGTALVAHLDHHKPSASK